MFKKLVYLTTFVIVLGLTPETANAGAAFQGTPLCGNQIGALLVSNAGPSLPCSSVEGFNTGDFSKFLWKHGGDESWTTTSREKHSGTYSAQAGGIEHNRSTTLQVTLNCVSDNISFYRKVSSEPRCDYLKFYIDGVGKGEWSGEEEWAEVSFPVPGGPRTFEWTYSKDGSESEGHDTAWIDDIVFPVDCNAEPPVYDPSLVGWWKLDDEGTGTVIDYSGNNRNGTLHGDPQWVPGFHGEALEFDGDDYVTIDGYKGVVGSGTNTPAWSVAAWVKTSGNGEVVGWGSTGNGNRMEFRISSGRTRAEGGGGNTQGDTTMNDGRWHHIAVTVAPNSVYSSGINLYLDGQLDTRTNADPDPWHPIANFDVIFGQRYNQSNERWFTGLIDDVRIYDRELTQAEIEVLAAPPTAHDPSPADGAVHSEMWVSLGWLPGSDAVSHNVYFGENFDDVAAGAPDTFRGNQSETFFIVGLAGSPYPDGLTMGKTYYWRVDEIEADGTTIRKGEVWSFKVRENLLVDDFDSYADTGELLLSWVDGTTNSTGSTISLESEFAGNAMKLIYDNSSAPWYSQAGRISSAPEDWTVGGAKALGLWLRGDVNNSVEQIYAALEDAGGRSAAVMYSDHDDLLQDRWEVWDIALQDFVDANDVDLANIKKLTIGVGDGVAAGGSGVVYIDDIRLYPPRCLPEYIATDFTADCVTDYEDLDVILRSWLVSDYNVVAQEPLLLRLQAHYKFDAGSGTTAYDSSDKGYHATVDAEGANAWDASGYDGGCLDFNGTFGVSVPKEVFSSVYGEVTVSVWVNVDANANPNTVGRIEFGAGPADPNQSWDRLAWVQERPEDYIGRWSHYAFVKDAGDGMMRIYHDGLLVAQNTEAFLPMSGAGAGPSKIGAAVDDTGGYYKGKLDDLRVYDYALTHAEVLYLAKGSGSQLYQPLQPVLSLVDPYEDGQINFRDFAVLADVWLAEQQWP